jgi:hypothetical protein
LRDELEDANELEGEHEDEHEGKGENMKQPQCSRPRGLLLAVLLGAAVAAQAKEGAHVHGLVRLDVAIDAKTLTVQLEAPLDSLLGFEHRPRTAAQKQAAEALLKQMNDGAALIRPEAAAQCKATQATVESAALQSTQAAGGKDEEHADLDASFEFTCGQPDKLASIDIGPFFDAFKRIQKIEAQVAGPQGQFKQALKRTDRTLRLRR